MVAMPSSSPMRCVEEEEEVQCVEEARRRRFLQRRRAASSAISIGPKSLPVPAISSAKKIANIG